VYFPFKSVTSWLKKQILAEDEKIYQEEMKKKKRLRKKSSTAEKEKEKENEISSFRKSFDDFIKNVKKYI